MLVMSMVEIDQRMTMAEGVWGCTEEPEEETQEMEDVTESGDDGCGGYSNEFKNSKDPCCNVELLWTDCCKIKDAEVKTE